MVIPESQVSDLFERSRVGLTVARRNDFIKTRILVYGFDDARIEIGLNLLKNAREKVKYQLEKYAEQKDLTDNLVKKKKKAKSRYTLYARNLKRELKGDISALDKLGLSARRIKTFDGFLERANLLYSNAIEDDEIFNKIQHVVGTKENLQLGWDLIIDVENLNTDQEEAKGSAQRATVEKDEALAALAMYMYYFTDACRDALSDMPQLLEKLKMRAYSKGYQKRKAAAAAAAAAANAQKGEEPANEEPPAEEPPPVEEPVQPPAGGTVIPGENQ